MHRILIRKEQVHEICNYWWHRMPKHGWLAGETIRSGYSLWVGRTLKPGTWGAYNLSCPATWKESQYTTTLDQLSGEYRCPSPTRGVPCNRYIRSRFHHEHGAPRQSRSHRPVHRFHRGLTRRDLLYRRRCWSTTCPHGQPVQQEIAGDHR